MILVTRLEVVLGRHIDIRILGRQALQILGLIQIDTPILSAVDQTHQEGLKPSTIRADLLGPVLELSLLSDREVVERPLDRNFAN